MKSQIQKILINYILAIAIGIFAGIVAYVIISGDGTRCVNNPIGDIEGKYHAIVTCFNYPSTTLCSILKNSSGN